MKLNWKFALMALAVAMTTVSCDNGNEPIHSGEDDNEEEAFVSPITVDGTFADWDALDASKVQAVTTVTNCTGWTALKNMKVYADKMYINILVEFDDAQIIDKSWVPFHVYLDADGSPKTGGYGDQYSDADVEVMLEGAVFSQGAPYSYDPAVFKWGGEVGASGWLWGDQTVEHSEADLWGATVGEGSGVAKSACTGNKIEIQILREMIPVTFASTFGIGVDIQQNWSSVGVLPNAADNAEDGSRVTAPKLRVTIDTAK